MSEQQNSKASNEVPESSFKTSNNEEEKNAILEAILAQKMAAATTPTNNLRDHFNRSNSIDSVCSLLSLNSLMSGADDHCRCDDCILGITDLLADISHSKLQPMPDAGDVKKTGGRKVGPIESLIKSHRNLSSKITQPLFIN